MQGGIGILGLGLYLPPDVRRNDAWSPELVARWAEQRPAPPQLPVPQTPGAERVLAAMRTQAADPFQGGRERHVLAPHLDITDMEELAARQALDDARLVPGDIDLLLTFAIVPEYLLSNPGCVLHARLGMSRECFTMQADAAAYSFLGQLALAESMIRSGRAHRALLVQSSTATRLIDLEDPQSVLVGDGATAVVVGPVDSSRGIQASVMFTDGRYPRSVIGSVRGGSWYHEGRVQMHVADWAQMSAVFLATADVCKESIDAVLERSGKAASDVDFLCTYQGTSWLGRVVQDYAGLGHARSHDTYPELGYLSAAMIPANLYLACERGLLREDDLVMMTGGGTGMTYGATLLRWGRS